MSKKLKGKLRNRRSKVVDVFDALTFDCPYRRRWPASTALAYIRENAGSHFDPQVVKAFVSMAWAEQDFVKAVDSYLNR